MPPAVTLRHFKWRSAAAALSWVREMTDEDVYLALVLSNA